MSIEMQPPHPRKDQPFTLLVRVLNPAGNAVTDASVHGVISLSTADRGRQEMDFTNVGGGLYEAQTKVAAAGAWEIWLTARHGHDRVQQYTPFQVKP